MGSPEVVELRVGAELLQRADVAGDHRAESHQEEQEENPEREAEDLRETKPVVGPREKYQIELLQGSRFGRRGARRRGRAGEAAISFHVRVEPAWPDQKRIS